MAWQDDGDFEKWLAAQPDIDENDVNDYKPVEPNVVFEASSYTGEGVDCETCGYSPDTLEYVEYDNGSISLQISMGCTGGAWYNSKGPDHSGADEQALNILESYSSDLFEEGVHETIIARLKSRLS